LPVELLPFDGAAAAFPEPAAAFPDAVFAPVAAPFPAVAGFFFTALFSVDPAALTGF
jgi:hypothetical protein